MKILNKITLDVRKITLLAIVSDIVLFLCYMQADIFITTRHGMNIWETIIQGRFTHFYEFNLYTEFPGMVVSKMHAMYEYVVYVFFAVWNLPLWLIEHFLGVDILYSIWGSLWMKSILIPFFCLFYGNLIEICEILGVKKERHQIISALLFTSPIFVQSFIVMSEYDIIGLSFIMLAVKYYLKDNLKKFTFYMSIAMPFKYFAAFFFIPLLLYKEKRIGNIIANMSGVMWLVIIPRFFIDYSSLKIVGSHLTVFDYVLGAKLNLFYEGLSVFMVCSLAWYVYVYFNDKFDTDKIITLCLVSISIVLICCKTHPQWAMYVLPFLLIEIAINIENENAMTLLFAILSVGLVMAEIVEYPFVFDTDSIKLMILTLFKTITTDHALSSGLERIGIPIEFIYELGGSMFVVGLIIFSILAYRKKKIECKIERELSVLVCYVFNISVYLSIMIAYFFMN